MVLCRICCFWQHQECCPPFSLLGIVTSSVLSKPLHSAGPGSLKLPPLRRMEVDFSFLSDFSLVSCCSGECSVCSFWEQNFSGSWEMPLVAR